LARRRIKAAGTPVACFRLGSRRRAAWLATRGHVVNRKRVQRLLGLAATHKHPDKIYPYPLGGNAIDRIRCGAPTSLHPNDARLPYLVVTMDWVSRAVVAWRLSNTLGADSVSNRGTRGRAPAIRRIRASDDFTGTLSDGRDPDRRTGIGARLSFCNEGRQHQSLNYRTRNNITRGAYGYDRLHRPAVPSRHVHLVPNFQLAQL
jgi:hypothetical protein